MKFYALLALAFASHSAQATPWVLLIPGAASSGSSVYVDHLPKFSSSYFGVYQKELSKAGIESIVCPEDADFDQRSVEERAEGCVQTILKRENKSICASGDVREVIVFGHSMGGLIARVLANDPRVSGCIKSVTTASTPHQGTPFADLMLKNSLAAKLGYTEARHRYLSEMVADRALYPAQNFYSQDVQDQPGIHYYSFSASIRWTDFNAVEAMRFTLEKEVKKLGLDQTGFGAANDGTVPEYSQVHGAYLGHLEASHMEMACVEFEKLTSGCHQAIKTILPFLEAQTHQN